MNPRALDGLFACLHLAAAWTPPAAADHTCIPSRGTGPNCRSAAAAARINGIITLSKPIKIIMPIIMVGTGMTREPNIMILAGLLARLRLGLRLAVDGDSDSESTRT